MRVTQIHGAAPLPWSTQGIRAAAVKVKMPQEILYAVQMKRCMPLMVASILAVTGWGIPRCSVAIRRRGGIILSK